MGDKEKTVDEESSSGLCSSFNLPIHLLW
jgi:hypothetical protein